MATELQLDKMTVAEKLQLVDELWMSITPELESLEV
ncbi:MAG: addiction module protein, partial [Pyrinomonadaceae bacterium]